MLLGSLALVGLSVTGPNMRKTGVDYFKEYNTADLTVLSDYGIDNIEQEQIEKADGIKWNSHIKLLQEIFLDTKKECLWQYLE